MKALQIAVIGVICLLSTIVNAATISFADPGFNGTLPWFAVNLTTDLITAGWPDTNANGITLLEDGAVVGSSAFFTMTPLNYAGGLVGGYTAAGAYSIKFYTDGADPGNDAPIFQIDFQQAYVSPAGLSASNDEFALVAYDVAFSGLLVGTAAGTAATNLSNETFGFTFANRKAINSSSSNGFTATASFTSSYEVIVPEPATLGILAMGAFFACRRRGR